MENRKNKKGTKLMKGEYQRKSGTYEYKWTKNGKRHSISARTIPELRKKKDELGLNEKKDIDTCNKYKTINDLYLVWLRLKRGLKDNTFKNYQYMYTHYVQPDFGRNLLKNVRKSDVKDFYNTLYDERGLKPCTIDVIHNVLQQVLQIAVEDEIISQNYCNRALTELKKAHNTDVEKRHALTVKQQKLFEDFLKTNVQYQHWYPIFYIMANTGLRVGECTGLRWEDIDLEKGEISVNHTLIYYSKGKENGCSFAVNTPKTKAGNRIIPMSSGVKKAFEMEREFQQQLGISCKATIDGYTDFIFINRFGNVQHQGTLNKALRRIIRDCNYEILDAANKKEVVTLPPFSCHNLRHTFATRCVEANMNAKAIQNIMGHADIETTLGIYAEAQVDFTKKEMANLEKVKMPDDEAK